MAHVVQVPLSRQSTFWALSNSLGSQNWRERDSIVCAEPSRGPVARAVGAQKRAQAYINNFDSYRPPLSPETSDTDEDEQTGPPTYTMEGRGKVLVFRSAFKGSLRSRTKRVLSGERRNRNASNSSSFGASSPRCVVSVGGAAAAPLAATRLRQGDAGVAAGADSKSPQKQQPYGVPDVRLPLHQKWDVVGLGQAMVDFSAMVDDEFIQELGMNKGMRKVIDHEERGQVLRALDGCSYKVSAGGSLSNTLVALARLGTAVPTSTSSAQAQQDRREEAVYTGCSCSDSVSPNCLMHGEAALAKLQATMAEVDPQQRQLHVAMTGSVGSDALGDFYRTKLLRANVHFLSEPIHDGTTGTVIVLTTPDAQRTMLAYMGMSSVVNVDKSLETAVSQSRVLVVEGYLWDIPKTVDAIERACQVAKARGTVVALTASDVFCVQRHWHRFWEVLSSSADILFANVDEARALTGSSSCTSPADMARHLSHYCPLVSVTDGDKGAYLAARGSKPVYIPPSPCTPVDSCGAGDAYAAGILYGLLAGVPSLRAIGRFASDVAAVVVGQQGARLKEVDAAALVKAHEKTLHSVRSTSVGHALVNE